MSEEIEGLPPRRMPALQPRWAPRCGARTRRGTQCQRRAFDNGRCRNHGGLSTGPKTSEGRARVAAMQTARWQKWREARNAPAIIILPDQSGPPVLKEQSTDIRCATPPPVLTGQQQAADGWDGIFFS